MRTFITQHYVLAPLEVFFLNRHEVTHQEGKLACQQVMDPGFYFWHDGELNGPFTEQEQATSLISAYENALDLEPFTIGGAPSNEELWG